MVLFQPKQRAKDDWQDKELESTSEDFRISISFLTAVMIWSKSRARHPHRVGMGGAGNVPIYDDALDLIVWDVS